MSEAAVEAVVGIAVGSVLAVGVGYLVVIRLVRVLLLVFWFLSGMRGKPPR